MITLIIARDYKEYEDSSYYRHGKYIDSLEDMRGYANCRLIRLTNYRHKWQSAQERITLCLECSVHNIKMEYAK